MTAEQPVRYVVVGGGVAGALMALALVTRLPSRPHTVTLVRDEGGDFSFGAIVSTRPDVRRFHADYEIDEDALIQAGIASFSLGNAYSGWSSVRPTFFLPYGDIGAPIGGVPFHLLAERMRRMGQNRPFADYSIATIMAQCGRFTRPSNDPQSVLSTFTYGLNLQSSGYAETLALLAERRGATVVRNDLRSVELVGERIDRLELAGGASITGDIFIDATGSRAAIAGTMPNDDWQRWEEFPFDRLVTLNTRASAPPALYAHVQSKAQGWGLTTPAASQVTETFAYASRLVSPDEAERNVLSDCRGGALHGSAHHRIITNGHRSPWNANCIAIGEAAVLTEPLHAMPFSLLLSGIQRLVRLLPTGSDMGTEAREFNRGAIEEIDRARDLAFLPYCLKEPSGEPAWDEARMSVSHELQRKLGLYASRGRVSLVDGDLLDESELAALFNGHGIQPERADALAESIPAARLSEQVKRMREVMVQAIAPLPYHGDYLGRLAAAAVAA